MLLYDCSKSSGFIARPIAMLLECTEYSHAAYTKYDVQLVPLLILNITYVACLSNNRRSQYTESMPLLPDCLPYSRWPCCYITTDDSAHLAMLRPTLKYTFCRTVLTF